MLKNRWRWQVVGWLGWAWSMGWFPVEAMAEKTAGDATWPTLFHGHDLERWDGDPRFWRVEQGVIVGARRIS
jgi:hypothetical protein